MKKNYFKGWTDVYGFTFHQATKGIGFRVVTVLISILIIGAFIVTNIINAKPEEAEKKSQIKEVYVLDQSGLTTTNYNEIIKQNQIDKFDEINFITEGNKSREDLIKHVDAGSDKMMMVVIDSTSQGFQFEAIIPESSSISEKDVNPLLETMIQCFESNKLTQVGLSKDQLTSVLKPVITSINEIGEETNEAAYFIKIFAPMIFSLMLYFMLLTHGQTISKEVSTEKTSKLMETLLTSVHPYALITGKVLAISSMAILQFLTWVAALFVGLYGGNAVARLIYPEYQNSVIQIIDFLRENIGETALSIPAIILAIVIFCVGFLFYCVLAGLAGCMVSKPEDVATTQGIFIFPIIISWLISYFSALLEKERIIQITRYVPFTAPFSIPVELITGSVGLIEGVISLSILVVFSLFVIMCSARIYKGLVLYNGQKLSLKTLGKVLKGN